MGKRGRSRVEFQRKKLLDSEVKGYDALSDLPTA
jgi:hypothetical protein